MPACTYGYVCEYGVCVPQGCFEFPCCYEGPCCGEGPCNDDGGANCYGIDQCYYGGQFCDDYLCVPIAEPPQCESPLAFTEVLGPTPGEINSVFALAFMQADEDEARELVIGHQDGVMLVSWQEPAQALPVPYGLVDDIAVADFDADGDEDLALELTPPGSYAELVILRNEGGGQFTALIPEAPTVFDLHAGDLDGDGLPDLVGALDFGPSFHVLGALPNVGALSFGDPSLLDTESQLLDLDIGDIDGNGQADVVGVNNTTQQVWYGTSPFNSVGSADFALQDALNYFAQMVVADFDGDDDDDIARLVALNGTTLVDTWSTVGGGLQEAPEWGWHTTPSLVLAEAGDLDGDGADDLVRAADNSLDLRFGAATAEMFGCGSRIDLPIYPFSMAIGDFTGDGSDDIAVQDGTSVQVYAAMSPP
jgi:hypothetical protein